MINKKIMVLILLVSLLAVSAVSAASDYTNDAISADANNDIILQESNDENLISDNDSGEIQSNDSDTKTFTDLHNLINVEYAANDTIFLNDDYAYCDGDGEFKGGVVIDRALTIYGNGIILDGSHLAGIFNVTNSNVVLENITFINGNAINGGAVTGECTVANSRFINNTAQVFGGAIYLGNAYDCVFINNTAIRGGAIYLGNVYNCVFTENSAKSMGGGAMYGGAATNSIFIHNTAALNYGGAIYCSENNCLISNCSFINNTAGYGGAISSNGFSFRAYNCNFTNNRGTTNGGAIFWSNNKANIYNCNFINNRADNNGGAIYCSSRGNSSIDGCNFIINHALLKGGAVYCEGNDCQVSDCNFTGNDANQGGAIYRGSGNVDVGSCDFANNTAANEGGAIFFANNGAVTSCNFMNNSAKNGGAIYFNGDINNVTVLGCFKGNNAERAGGAIYVKGESMKNNFSSQFYDNNARNASGGAIFFYSLAENNSFEGIFMNNYALYGGGIFFYKKANNNKFDSNFTFNVAESCGGAIFFYNTTDNNNFTGYFTKNSALGKVSETVGNGGAITFKDVSTNCRFVCDFINNTAALNGGGVNYRQTPHNITFNCNFIANNAPRGGGVNFFESFENVIFNGEFINNSAVDGGAIAAGAGSIKEVSFKDNHAENGGAVYFSSSSGTVENCNFTNNKASYGGAVYCNGSDCSIINCSFSNNSASYGGAIYIRGDGCSISGCNFANNSAETDGGAVYCSSNNNTINHCNFTNNAAKNGGAIYFIYAGTVHDCYFEENTVERVEHSKDSTGFGGAIYFASDGEVFNSTFYKNQANGGFGWYYDLEEIWVYSRGGAIYISGNGLVSNSKFYKNEANTGSAIFSGMSTLEVSNSEFIANKGRYGGFSWTFALPDYMAAIFDCQNNYINAIYKQPGKNITLSNVTYWNGEIVNTDDGYPIKEFLGIPFNLSIRGCDGNIYYNALYIPNGTNIMPYDLSLASYPNGDITIGVYHKEDDYFEECNNTVTIIMDLYSRSNSSVSINTAESEFVYGNCYINFATENTCGYYIVITDEDGKIVYEKINKSSGINPFDDPLISPTYDGQDYNELIFVDLPAGCYNMTVYGLGSLTVRGGSDSKLFRILPLNSTINVDTTEISLDVNGIVNLNATLNPADAGTLTYASSNSNVVTVDADGNVHAVGVGKANVTVSLADNGVYVAENKTIAVSVNKVATAISAPDVTVAYRNTTGELVATIADAYGEPLSVDLNVDFNGESYTVKADSNGQISIPIGILTPKTYVATISYDGDDTHVASSATANVVVTRADTVISAPDVSVAYKDAAAELAATITNAYGKALAVYVTVNLNGASYDVKANSKGQIAVSTSNLAPGTYTATITYNGNGNYNPTSTTAKVTVSKADTIITAPDVSVNFADPNGKLVATLTNAYGKALGVYVTVNLNGVNYTVKANSKGQITVSAADLTPKTYTATITYNGNGNYNPTSATAKITVKKADTVITAPDTSVAFKNTTNKTIATLTNAYGKGLAVYVNVTLNGESYVVRANYWGEISVSTAKLTPGTYTATISYKGNGNYYGSTATSQITVTKADTIMNAPDTSVAYKNTTNKTIATLTDAYGKGLAVYVNVTLNGEKFAVRANYWGQISVSTVNLAPGTYTATVSYKGNGNYKGSTATSQITVDKVDTTITAPDISVAYKDTNGKLVATLTNAYGKALSVYVTVNLNGVNYTVRADSKGQISISTADLTPGTYTATISYKGNGNYNPTTTTAQVTVNKADTVITAPDVTVNCGNPDGKLVATLTNAYGKALGVYITYNLNGADYTVRANSKGQINIPTKDLAPGNYTTVITYFGNGNYNPATTTANIAVI